MPRHPGIQHSYRLKEIAEGIAHASGAVQESFSEIRRLEERADEFKAKAAAAQKKLDALLKFQQEVIEASLVTEFGLPSGTTKEECERITGVRITS